MNEKNASQNEPTTDILGDIIVKEKVVLSNYKKLFIVITITLLMVLNLYLSHKSIFNSPKDIEEKQLTMTGGYYVVLVSLPIAAFVLSFLISFIPYKKLKYFKKYFPFALIILLILQIILLIMISIGMIRNYTYINIFLRRWWY